MGVTGNKLGVPTGRLLTIGETPPWNGPTPTPAPSSEVGSSNKGGSLFQGNPLENKSDHVTQSLDTSVAPQRPRDLIEALFHSPQGPTRAASPCFVTPSLRHSSCALGFGTCLAPSSLRASGPAGASACTIFSSLPADALSSGVTETPSRTPKAPCFFAQRHCDGTASQGLRTQKTTQGR